MSITVGTAAYITFGAVALLSVLLLRLSVRFMAKGADNGWDNAFAYLLVSTVLGALVAWLFARGSFLLALGAPLVVWTGQTLALRFIYEVRTARAWLLGTVHTLLLSTVVGGLALGAAAAYCYYLYGRIISDPLFLLRLILRLIGFELPA